jgi:hypothetical protein
VPNEGSLHSTWVHAIGDSLDTAIELTDLRATRWRDNKADQFLLAFTSRLPNTHGYPHLLGAFSVVAGFWLCLQWAAAARLAYVATEAMKAEEALRTWAVAGGAIHWAVTVELEGVDAIAATSQ